MFRKLYNRAIFEAELVPEGPILIMEGGPVLDPTAPDLAFVRTLRGRRSTVYVPGASLKGVIRSHAERILATEMGPNAAEDPFDRHARRRREARSARERRGGPDRPAVYRSSCEADRVFGSTEIAGRFRIADALPVDDETLAAANRTEVRYSVAIDRVKQSARGAALFEQEAVTQGAFKARAVLENYELWMLALVLQVLRDLNDGFVQIGHAKTRGFGTVRLGRPSVRLLWPGDRPGRLQGAGARETDQAVVREYGLTPGDEMDVPEGAEAEQASLFQGYRFEDWPAVEALLDGLIAGPWGAYAAGARKGEGRAS